MIIVDTAVAIVAVLGLTLYAAMLLAKKVVKSSS